MFAAISLEWDKQPHYLEASLMMKGYSAEEARAAAQRARRPVAGTRPPLAATAYVTTRDKVNHTTHTLTHIHTDIPAYCFSVPLVFQLVDSTLNLFNSSLDTHIF